MATKKTEAQVKAAMAKVEAAKKAEAAKVEEKKAPVKKTAAKATEEKKAPAKKTVTKATEEKKAPAKKAPAKKAATVKTVETVHIQACGYDITTQEVVDKVVAVVGKKVKELNIYVKPEDAKVYYTADGEIGSVDL